MAQELGLVGSHASESGRECYLPVQVSESSKLSIEKCWTIWKAYNFWFTRNEGILVKWLLLTNISPFFNKTDGEYPTHKPVLFCLLFGKDCLFALTGNRVFDRG